MSRTTIFTKLSIILTVVFSVVSLAGAAVLLEDDFTNAEASSGKWARFPAALTADAMPVTIGGGSAVIDNKTEGDGEYLHSFPGPAVPTTPYPLTITFTLKSVEPGTSDAGVFFCRQSEFKGYYYTISNGHLALYRFDGNSGKSIYYRPSSDLKPSDNKLMVSKNEAGEFHLVLNDVWQGSVIDAEQILGRDVSLFVSAGTKGTFGAFTMTDEFTGLRKSFKDDFSGGDRRHWKDLEAGGTTAYSVNSGVMTMTTPAGAGAWTYADVDLSGADFEVSTAVRHVVGGAASGDFYGIVLKGDAPTDGGTIPMLHFGITGNKFFGIWSSVGGGSFIPVLDSIIRGTAGAAQVIYIDTLTVRKKAGATTYEFIINGKTVSTSQALVSYKVTGAGIFTSPNANLTIAVNEFYAGPEDRNSPVVWGSRDGRHGIRNGLGIKRQSDIFYDLRGRRSYSKTTPKHNMRTRAAGVYINENGREVMVRRGRR